VVHISCILYNILDDFKEVQFESVFLKVDALNAILAPDQLAYDRVQPYDTSMSYEIRNYKFWI